MSEQKTLLELVNSLRGVHVLCVGDVMLDRFVYGDVERISPEAPIPVVLVKRESSMLGGAGNVVRNLVSLGALPHFLAVVGDDLAGREVTGLVGHHVEVDPLLVVEAGRQTTIKTRFFAGSQQLLRADHETQAPLLDDSRNRILEEAQRLLPHVGVLILSDYGKGVLGRTLTGALIQAARLAGKPVVVDPKGKDYSVYVGATVVTPNRKELHDATAMVVADDQEVVAAARRLIDDSGVGHVLVTRSQDGMSLISPDGVVHHLPAEAREVYDVSGAGDTVVAALAAALAAGATLADAAKVANVAAGIVVGKVGTAVAYTSDLIAALHQRDVAAAESKVAERPTALERINLWRRQGHRVGFTIGCFDLLHPGHVSLLSQAKAKCDKLVVGLNSDASVVRLKGPDRPVQSESARATVLASLASVDMVVIFDEDTPRALIEAFRPDLLVKGADYTVQTVVGADFVESYGGKVLLAELSPGFSTTATIARMNK